MNQESLSAGQKKVQEYVSRIQGGEDRKSITEGLSPSFIAGIEAGLQPKTEEAENPLKSSQEASREEEPRVPPQYEGLDADTLEFIWTIPEYVDPEKTKSEKARKLQVVDALRAREKEDLHSEVREVADQLHAEEAKLRLGIGSEAEVEAKKKQLDTLHDLDDETNAADHTLSGILKYVTKGRRKDVIDLYNNLYDHRDEPATRKRLAEALFQDIYNKYRIADYPVDLEEDSVWEKYLQSTDIPVNNKKTEWMYRGMFPKNGQETVTRGSFNVHVTPELIDGLDTMIKTGKIKANYKFGQPGTKASPTERHDSISIYFLEQPSDEVLHELGALVKPFVRGDQLLGIKIEDGFFMSEIGSVESEQITGLVDELRKADLALADAVKSYTTPRVDRGTKLQMSEAQFYAVKDVARAFGYTVSYDKNNGFSVEPSS